ncbi:MAG: GNAT family N-acetyltransferase [Anaerolineae bacterium]|nr:GNAT family N-acetyltransferase [Anaerolineae bacterium]
MDVLTNTNAGRTALIIRDAIETDLEACVRLDHTYTTDQVWQMELQEEPGRVGVAFRPVRLPRPMRVVYARDAEALQRAWDQRGCFLVASVSGRVHGYLTMQADIERGNGWVRDLAVEEGWRRRGIGGALLKAARQWARENDLSRLTVETQTKNYPAICFCEKYGLTFCGFNDQYYPNQDIALFFAQRV